MNVRVPVSNDFGGRLILQHHSNSTGSVLRATAGVPQASHVMGTVKVKPEPRSDTETVKALADIIRTLLGLDKHKAFEHNSIAEQHRCDRCRARAAAVRELKRSNAYLRRVRHVRKEKVST